MNSYFELQNEKSLTFLYRAPKLILKPLNLGSIARSYEKLLKVDKEKSYEMAKLTKGYSFAFQVLGYLYWDNPSGGLYEILPYYDQYLDEYVYEKIWSELSSFDRDIMIALSQMEDRVRVKDLRDKIK